MSWGAWTLMAITPLSVIWAGLHIKDFFPNWDWKFEWVKSGEAWLAKNKVGLAWAMVILALILGIYTGILFSAFNSRPLWNTSILGPLFLVSGLSAGAAAIVLMSKNESERHAFAKIDLGLIVIELFLIVHMFMGFFAGSQSKIDAAKMFLGGEFTASFWVFVVALGLVIPASLEVMEMSKKKVPYMVAPILVLLGGLIFRFVMAHAGQISHWASN
jgi:formate-dependent nitrite reductase membrane component NrfD